MCGIVGYVGHRLAEPVLVEGLARLEYRGYDSAGVCTLDSAGVVTVRRAVGKLKALRDRLATEPCLGTTGIGTTHTRTRATALPSFTTASSKTTASFASSCRLLAACFRPRQIQRSLPT